MPIVNRDLDSSQQREVYQALINGSASGISAGIQNPGVATALTFPLCTISRPGSLVAAQVAAWGISGTPSHSLWVYRFAGGFTSIQVGASIAPTAFGTSGSLGYSILPAATSFPLLAGDQLVLATVTANSAFAQVTMTMVVRALQDIKTDFGV